MNRILDLLATYAERNPKIFFDVLDILFKEIILHPEIGYILMRAIAHKVSEVK